MKVVDIPPMDVSVMTKGDGISINPFLQDIDHMGTYMGTNVAVMYRNFPKEECPYLIIIDTRTGERKKIVFGEE